MIDHIESRGYMLLLYDVCGDTLSNKVCVNMLKRRCHQCNVHDLSG
jgi:hypothetical protein